MTETIELALKTLETQLNQPLETALEACARCGICAEACHYYRAEPKVEHIPAHRAEQLRSVYRYEHDFLSRLFPVWTYSKKLDEPTLAHLTEIAFTQCTLCRRCTVNCPLGVDTPLIMRAIRAMASAAGTAPEILVMLADAAIEKGKDPSFFKEMFLEQIREMEEQLREITGDPNANLRFWSIAAGQEMLTISDTFPFAHELMQHRFLYRGQVEVNPTPDLLVWQELNGGLRLISLPT